jgi:hypothetical protein
VTEQARLIDECPRCHLTLDVLGVCPRKDCDYSRPKLADATRDVGRAGVDSVRARLRAAKDPTPVPKRESAFAVVDTADPTREEF